MQFPCSPAVGPLLPPLVAKYSIFMGFPLLSLLWSFFYLGSVCNLVCSAATHLVVLACVGGRIQKQARRNGWQKQLYKLLFLLELPSCLSCCFKLLFHSTRNRVLSVRSGVPQQQNLNCSSGINSCCSSNLFRKCQWINFYKQASD